MIAIEAVINSQVDSVLYEDKSFVDKGGDNLVLKAWKNGAIKMAYEEDVLIQFIPLAAAVSGSNLSTFTVPTA